MGPEAGAKHHRNDRRSQEIGEIDVLDAGKGHLEIAFNPADQAERENARRTVEDLLVKGYSLVDLVASDD